MPCPVLCYFSPLSAPVSPSSALVLGLEEHPAQISDQAADGLSVASLLPLAYHPQSRHFLYDWLNQGHLHQLLVFLFEQCLDPQQPGDLTLGLCKLLSQQCLNCRAVSFGLCLQKARYLFQAKALITCSIDVRNQPLCSSHILAIFIAELGQEHLLLSSHAPDQQWNQKDSHGQAYETAQGKAHA